MAQDQLSKDSDSLAAAEQHVEHKKLLDTLTADNGTRVLPRYHGRLSY